MGAFTALRISASALTAERLRMDVIANNIANQQTTRAVNGKPYRRRVAVFVPLEAHRVLGRAQEVNRPLPDQMGVRVAAIVEDPRPGMRVYNPNHPDADAEGYVTYPNVDIVTEMVDMMSAARAYEANLIAAQTAKQMALRALDIGR
ncbi:MAG: flagellar basal body rod protein FlgC [Anaerolineae bacterium]|nr:flagellar basal body rod protein FlgC [Anaerolineae bacterium]MDW8099724.1 flagellar basal body rod protein FlgC [Anaerolineae bacterium]